MPDRVTGEPRQLQASEESGQSTKNRAYEVKPPPRDLALSTSSADAYQHLLQSKVMGIFIANLDGSVTDANNTFLKMVGHEYEDLPLRWDAMTPPEFRRLDEAKVREALDTGAAMPWEKDYIRRDGSRISVLVGASVIDKARGQSICFAVDLSRAQRAEAARHRSEQRYLALYDNIPLMCLTVDSAGTILTINAYGAEHLGYRPNELVGQSVLGVVHPEDVDKAEEQLRAALAERGCVVKCELRKVRRDGSFLWTQEVARAVPENSERLLVVCEDITERRQKDEQLAQYQDKLKSLTIESVLAEERERRRVAQGLHDQVGHALALAKMKASSLAASECLPDAQQMMPDLIGYLNEAISATRTLTFELSSPVLHEVGLEAALQSLGEQLQHETKISFHFESDPPRTPMIQETSVIIYRIVEELLFNVLKHARAHNVHVCVHRAGNSLQVNVEDDGMGLKPSEDGELLKSHGRFGLFSIRARIEQLGGQFHIGPSDMGGVRADLIVPIERKEISAEAPPTRLGRDEPLSSHQKRRQQENR